MLGSYDGSHLYGRLEKQDPHTRTGFGSFKSGISIYEKNRKIIFFKSIISIYIFTPV